MITKKISNRSNRQVRECCVNFPRKDISQEPFTEEEFELLEKKVEEHNMTIEFLGQKLLNSFLEEQIFSLKTNSIVQNEENQRIA
jgi:hypothetical protein